MFAQSIVHRDNKPTDTLAELKDATEKSLTAAARPTPISVHHPSGSSLIRVATPSAPSPRCMLALTLVVLLSSLPLTPARGAASTPSCHTTVIAVPAKAILGQVSVKVPCGQNVEIVGSGSVNAGPVGPVSPAGPHPDRQAIYCGSQFTLMTGFQAPLYPCYSLIGRFDGLFPFEVGDGVDLPTPACAWGRPADSTVKLSLAINGRISERATYSGSWGVAITSGVTHRQVYLGAWLGGTETLPSKIRAFQAASGRHLDLINLFADWNTTFPEIESWWLDTVYQNHSLAMITWQPNNACPSDIANGKEDSYITEFAADVARFHKHIFIRPMHEMNFASPQNPYEWTIGGPCKTTNATFIAAWKRIVEIFRQQKAKNALFVWCINNVNSTWTGASFMGAYPGDKFVSVIGIDGYNWGYLEYVTQFKRWNYTIKITLTYPFWRSFAQIFDRAYGAVTRKTSKQIFITEWSSAEPYYFWQQSKADWITDAFEQVTGADFDQVRGVVWFNENKERDWRINSSAGAESAYRNATACIPHAGF